MEQKKERVMLIVDDMGINRSILKRIFCGQYKIIEASGGAEAIQLLHNYRKELVVLLLDIIMPEVDGFEVLSYMQREEMTKSVPVILITGDSSTEIKKRGYQMGASDIIDKPFDRFIVKTRVDNIVELYQHKNHLEELVDSQTRKLKEVNYRLIDILGNIVEFRDVESGAHIFRVKQFTKILAECVAEECPEYGLSKTSVELITNAAALHDIGKIAIPDRILLKPGKLTREEFEVMKIHTIKGDEIINSIGIMEDKTYFNYCCEIARSHHEKYDGKGYPDGLKGEEIPISAQIVAVADVYDALVSKRVYKDAYGRQKAYEMIQNGECGFFSKKLMKCFERVKCHFEALLDNYVEKENIMSE